MPNNNNNNAVSSSFLLPLSTASSIQTYLKSSGFHDDDFFVSASSVSSAVSSAAPGGSSFNLHVLWRKLYEDLASLAFSTASIEDAFRTLLQLVRPNQLTRLHLIDFLIVNTPLQKLPTDVRGAASQWTTSSNTFETSSGTEETAAIKYVAQPQTKQTQQQIPPPQPQPPPPQAISKKRATEDADADAAKAFIRNMTFDDSDSDESADSSSSAASSSAAHFEPSDDPLCDPLGPPWRRKLTFEYARARRTATSAKDAQAKKLAGQQIGKCKREAREAKLDAAVLDALAEPLLRHWDELGRAPWEVASSSPPPPPSPPQENSEEEDEAPPTLDLDLFVQDDDDTSNTTTWRPPPPPPTAASALLNPSALLQSVCPRLNSKAPRFDQLKGGGMAVRLWASGPRRKNASTASGSHAFEATLSDASSLHPDAAPRELACVRALVGLLEPAGGALAVSAQGVSAEAVELERVRCYHSLKDDWARDAWSKACGGILEGEENAPRAQLDEDARRNEFIEELISTISPSSQPQYHDPSNDDEQQHRQQQHNMRSRTTTTTNRPTGQWPPPHPDNPLLPAHALRDAIIDTARSCPAMVITGETGSGKSTQVPQFILDGADGNANILVCQPRRVAAMSLAARVAAERGEASPGGVSGYHIRGSRVASSRTRVLFATCGMALRLLRDGGDEIFTHVVVDEVHERSIETDLLLALLSRMRRRRANTARELGVLLMSATCDVDMWLRYLGSGSRHVHIEGRTFPVTTLYLDDILPGRALAALGAAIQQQEDEEEDQDDEDNDSYSDSNDGASIVDATSSPLSLSIASYQPSPDESEDDVCTSTDLLCASIEMADDVLSEQEAASGALRGSILVFLPSIAQCESLAEMLRGSRRFGADGKGEWIVALHSRSDAETQKRAFAIVPEKARCRKVVLATNVAEASVTIADVACVVDTGREKRIVHRRRRGTSQLMERWVSRQSARQRAGRAGRTRKGLCIRLYTRQRHDEGMAAARAPEMRVARLDRALMECIAYAPTARDLGELIAALPEPPEASSTIAAWSDLRELGAVDGDMDVAMLSQQSATLTVDTGDGSVTSLGRVLCELPCAPAVSKVRLNSLFCFCFALKGMDLCDVLGCGGVRIALLCFRRILPETQQACGNA